MIGMRRGGVGRRAGAALVTAGMAVVLSTGLGVATASPAAATDPPTAAVALGDSFISGEGAGDYLAVVDRSGVAQGFPGWSAPNSSAFFCHRSANASIEVAPLEGIDARFDLACSGGRPHDILSDSADRSGGREVRAQIDQLRAVAQTHDIDLVLVGLGSNNTWFNFGDLVATCAGRFVADGYSGWWEPWTWGVEQDPCDSGDLPSASELAQARAETLSALRQVLTTLVAVDADGDHRVVLQDYTNPLPPEYESGYHTEDGRSDTRDKYRALVRERYRAGCPAHRATLPTAHLLSQALGDLVAGVVADLRAEFPGTDLVYLDVQHAFDGARLCERSGSPAGALATPIRLQDRSGGVPTGVFLDSIDSFDKIGIQRIQGVCRDWFQTCQESWHPNAQGHQVLGQCLGFAWSTGATEVHCLRDPTSGTLVPA